jgi:hypothetical protein
MGQLTMKAQLEPWSDANFFGKLRMLKPVLLHNQLLLANRNLARGLWWLVLERRCDLRKLQRGV